MAISGMKISNIFKGFSPGPPRFRSAKMPPPKKNILPSYDTAFTFNFFSAVGHPFVRVFLLDGTRKIMSLVHNKAALVRPVASPFQLAHRSRPPNENFALLRLPVLN